MKRKKKTVRRPAKEHKPRITVQASQKDAPMEAKTPFNKAKLKEFEQRLMKIKGMLREGMDHLENSSLKKSGRDASGDLSNLPIHLADTGSDTFEQDFSLGLLEGEDIELKEIDEALERIENKTYGICEECSNPIAENRLKVIPYARLCVKCQESMEKR
ncbi:MAG: TraR/DksA C4-type zinc finger protein [Planctomycetota bacterium]